MSSRPLFIGFSVVLVTVSLGFLYADSLAFLFGYWIDSEDYSHGIFVPLISLFLIWQARNRLTEAGTDTAWWGLAVMLGGLFSTGSVIWPRCLCCNIFRFGSSLWGWSLRRSEFAGPG